MYKSHTLDNGQADTVFSVLTTGKTSKERGRFDKSRQSDEKVRERTKINWKTNSLGLSRPLNDQDSLLIFKYFDDLYFDQLVSLKKLLNNQENKRESKASRAFSGRRGQKKRKIAGASALLVDTDSVVERCGRLEAFRKESQIDLEQFRDMVCITISSKHSHGNGSEYMTREVIPRRVMERLRSHRLPSCKMFHPDGRIFCCDLSQSFNPCNMMTDARSIADAIQNGEIDHFDKLSPTIKNALHKANIHVIPDDK